MKKDIFKPSVRVLTGYRPEPQEAVALLNANESPYNLPDNLIEKIQEAIGKIDFNRYPDPLAKELTETYARHIGADPAQVMAGSGLDEILSIIINATIEPGDTVVSHQPGFSMYEIWTEIAGGNFVGVRDHYDRINISEIINESIRNDAKLIFICAPNNPTGYLIPEAELKQILEETQALVVLDEAYTDFADRNYMEILKTYDNLLLLRTLSKAYRIPSARCGFVIGSPEIIDVLRKIKSPYNLNTLTQTVAKIVLDNADQLKEDIQHIRKERDELYSFLRGYPEITVHPSQANFLFIRTLRHKELQEAFLKKGVLVRYLPEESGFRITIGTDEENELVKSVISEVFDEISA